MLGCGTRVLGVRDVVGDWCERVRLGRFWGLAASIGYGFGGFAFVA